MWGWTDSGRSSARRGQKTFSNMHNGEVLAAALMRLLPEDKLEAVTDAMVAGCLKNTLKSCVRGCWAGLVTPLVWSR